MTSLSSSPRKYVPGMFSHGSPRSSASMQKAASKRSLAYELRQDIKLKNEEFNQLLFHFKKESSNGNGLNKQQFIKIITAVLSERFDEKTLPAFYRIYEAFDSDGNGEIDFVELATGISTLLYGPESNVIKMIFGLIDKNGDGEVQVEELMEFFKKFFKGQAKMSGYQLTKQRWAALQDHLTRCFKAADKDGSGAIDMAEFSSAVEDPDHPLGMLYMQCKPGDINYQH